MQYYQILSNLNKEQEEAATYTKGGLLILAGAGTGKTRTLISRICTLLANGQAHPSQILALTFTNKAAQEMRERIGALMNERVASQIRCSTFHSICASIIRNNPSLVNLTKNFTIIDKKDQTKLIAQIIKDEDLDWSASVLSSCIDRYKEKANMQESYQDFAKTNFGNAGIKILSRYQETLIKMNCCDFSDLILHVIKIFKQNPTVLEHYRKMWPFIHVDEYQDTNNAQLKFLMLLSNEQTPEHHICAVGDDDQCIYTWRGAQSNNILKFSQYFKDSKIIKLEKNYRSTKFILDAATNIIKHNQSRLPKTLTSALGTGEPVRLTQFTNDLQEADLICRTIMEKHKYHSVGILVRTSNQTRVIEEALIRNGIPYKLIGDTRFYERQEIKDILSYLTLLINPNNDIALLRALIRPKRGIGSGTIDKLAKIAQGRQCSLFEIFKYISMENDQEIEILCKGIRASTRKAIFELTNKINNWIEQKDSKNIIELVLEESGYLNSIQEEKERIDNIDEMIRAYADFNTLDAFIEHSSLVMENYKNTEENSSVSLMTLHAAKGLEFDAVFLPGWEEELLPHSRSLKDEQQNGNADAVEEERRLAHVGITRAKEYCYVSFCKSRYLNGEWKMALPARFIAEMGPNCIEYQDDNFFI